MLWGLLFWSRTLLLGFCCCTSIVRFLFVIFTGLVMLRSRFALFPLSFWLMHLVSS